MGVGVNVGVGIAVGSDVHVGILAGGKGVTVNVAVLSTICRGTGGSVAMEGAEGEEEFL